MSMKPAAWWRRVGLCAVLAVSFALGACSTVDELTHGSKIDYKSAGTLPPLDIPPDLAAPDYSDRYAMPGGSGSTTLSGFKAERKEAATQLGRGQVLPKVSDMHIVRDGSERWLVVENETPQQLWPKIKQFWQANGFLLKSTDPAAGVMQTGWAENRAKIPQGFIRNTLGKLFSDLYSTPQRDMFRTRLERTPNGKGTEVYISHRGMQEVYVGSPDTEQPLDRTRWEPSPADPGLEAIFLRRLMVSLGESKERAKEMVAAASQKPRAALAAQAGLDQLKVFEPFPNAWRRVGLALDRVGFTVEDQNREKGLYYVRYADPDAQPKKDTGFLSKLEFWRSSSSQAKPKEYQVQVRQVGGDSIVRVLDAHGTPSKSETARKILSLLYGQLK